MPPTLKFPLARRVLIWVLLTAGAYLSVSAAARGVLMLAGDSTIGDIESADKAYGMARGTAYRVHYNFQVNGRTLHGDASTVAAAAPTGPLRVRFLRFMPQLNGPDSQGYLSIGLLARLLPAVFFIFSGLVLLQER